MQETDDIQRNTAYQLQYRGCGLMQETDDIQLKCPPLLHFRLWFDVGNGRYTTEYRIPNLSHSCGLMQETDDIQPYNCQRPCFCSCGLMQETDDIQLTFVDVVIHGGCGLMQETDDIQPQDIYYTSLLSCGLMQETDDIQHSSSGSIHWIVVV